VKQIGFFKRKSLSSVRVCFFVVVVVVVCVCVCVVCAKGVSCLIPSSTATA